MASSQSSKPATRVAVYSGTFDPFTLGHEDVVRRAAGLFDHVLVAVAVAHHKKTLFSLAERVAQVAQAVQGLQGFGGQGRTDAASSSASAGGAVGAVAAGGAASAKISVLPFDGLIMDFCKQHGAVAVVRGVRNLSDFDYEVQMAAMNRKLLPQVETVFVLPDAQLQCISSTLVREISKLGGDVTQLVNPAVALALKAAHAKTGAT